MWSEGYRCGSSSPAGAASWGANASTRKWNLWGYIDARDGAQAVAKTLECGGPAFETLSIAAADTVMERTSAELARALFPDAPLSHPLRGRETLLSIDKARRGIGFEPEHDWQSELAPLTSAGGR